MPQCIPTFTTSLDMSISIANIPAKKYVLGENNTDVQNCVPAKQSTMAKKIQFNEFIWSIGYLFQL